MKIIRDLKGGSLSQTSVISNGNEMWVRKSVSIENNREYGLVRWHSQIRKNQVLRDLFPEYVLPIINSGIDGDFYFFDLPFLENSQNLFEALNSGVSERLIAKHLYEIVKRIAANRLEGVPGSFSVYLFEEVLRPLLRASNEVDNEITCLTQEEIRFFKNRINFIIPKIKQLISSYSDIELFESFTHGNLTLENVIWDYDNSRLFLIDSYAETYCESVLGDVSQIYQSSLSGYEAVSNLFSKGEISTINYPYFQIPEVLKAFGAEFDSFISSEEWYDYQILKLFRASQFTRMFPFKIVNNPRLAFLFLNHAMDLLEDF